MKIEKVEGCTCNYLGIDGVQEFNFTEEQRKQYFKEICDKIPTLDSGWFNRFLQWVAEEFGEFDYVTEKPCECCGDIVTKNTLEI